MPPLPVLRRPLSARSPSRKTARASEKASWPQMSSLSEESYRGRSWPSDVLFQDYGETQKNPCRPEKDERMPERAPCSGPERERPTDLLGGWNDAGGEGGCSQKPRVSLIVLPTPLPEHVSPFSPKSHPFQHLQVDLLLVKGRDEREVKSIPQDAG